MTSHNFLLEKFQLKVKNLGCRNASQKIWLKLNDYN